MRFWEALKEMEAGALCGCDHPDLSKTHYYMSNGTMYIDEPFSDYPQLATQYDKYMTSSWHIIKPGDAPLVQQFDYKENVEKKARQEVVKKAANEVSGWSPEKLKAGMAQPSTVQKAEDLREQVAKLADSVKSLEVHLQATAGALNDAVSSLDKRLNDVASTSRDAATRLTYKVSRHDADSERREKQLQEIDEQLRRQFDWLDNLQRTVKALWKSEWTGQKPESEKIDEVSPIDWSVFSEERVEKSREQLAKGEFVTLEEFAKGTTVWPYGSFQWAIDEAKRRGFDHIDRTSRDCRLTLKLEDHFIRADAAVALNWEPCK